MLNEPTVESSADVPESPPFPTTANAQSDWADVVSNPPRFAKPVLTTKDDAVQQPREVRLQSNSWGILSNSGMTSQIVANAFLAWSKAQCAAVTTIDRSVFVSVATAPEHTQRPPAISNRMRPVARYTR